MDVKRQIREHVRASEIWPEEKAEHRKIRMEFYQRYYENGMAERSRESGTEAGYDLVDGRINNEKKTEETNVRDQTAAGEAGGDCEENRQTSAEVSGTGDGARKEIRE